MDWFSFLMGVLTTYAVSTAACGIALALLIRNNKRHPDE